MDASGPWPEGWFPGWLPETMRQTFAGLPGMASWQKMTAPPGAGVQALAGLVQDRLVGRTVSLDLAGHVVTGTLVSLDADPGPAGLLAGQFENVRLVARDLEWQGRGIRELTVTGRNVHLRPGRVALLVAAPVEVVAVVSEDDLASWLTEVPEQYRLWLSDDGVACASLRRFPDVGHVEFEPLVAGREVHLLPRRYVLRRRGVPIPLRGLSLSLSNLPENLLFRRVETRPGEVRVEMLLTEFRQPLSPGPLERFADLVRRGGNRIEIPGSS